MRCRCCKLRQLQRGIAMCAAPHCRVFATKLLPDIARCINCSMLHGLCCMNPRIHTALGSRFAIRAAPRPRAMEQQQQQQPMHLDAPRPTADAAATDARHGREGPGPSAASVPIAAAVFDTGTDARVFDTGTHALGPVVRPVSHSGDITPAAAGGEPAVTQPHVVLLLVGPPGSGA